MVPGSALAELLSDEIWAVRPAAMRAFLSWANANPLPVEAALVPGDRSAKASRVGSTAILAVHGPLTRRATGLSLLCGGASLQDITDGLREAVADDTVSRIVLDVDSPGGAIDGITELAAEIYEARQQKPISAFIDTKAASAAYWLAAQASEIVVTPSGAVGSIGVFALHLDESRATDAAGITPTFIQAGEYKTEENPLQPLSSEARATIQARVDVGYRMFLDDVARGRGVDVAHVREAFGKGRMVLAREAVALGMADRVGVTVTQAQAKRTDPSWSLAAAAEGRELELALAASS